MKAPIKTGRVGHRRNFSLHIEMTTSFRAVLSKEEVVFDREVGVRGRS